MGNKLTNKRALPPITRLRRPRGHSPSLKGPKSQELGSAVLRRKIREYGLLWALWDPPRWRASICHQISSKSNYGDWTPTRRSWTLRRERESLLFPLSIVLSLPTEHPNPPTTNKDYKRDFSPKKEVVRATHNNHCKRDVLIAHWRRTSERT